MSDFLFEAHLRGHLEGLEGIECFEIVGWLEDLTDEELGALLVRLEAMLSDDDVELRYDLAIDLLLSIDLLLASARRNALGGEGCLQSGLEELESAMRGLEPAVRRVAFERVGLGGGLSRGALGRLVERRWMSDEDEFGDLGDYQAIV